MSLMGGFTNGISKAVTPLLGQGGMGQAPGILYQWGGQLANAYVGAINQLLPGALSSVLGGIDYTSIFTSAFSMPFANFQRQLWEAQDKFNQTISAGWGKIDDAAFRYGKTMGMTAQQVEKLRDEMLKIGNATEENWAGKFSKSISEVIALQGKYNETVGRNIQLTTEQQTSLAALASALGDDGAAVKFAASLEKFGISANGAGEMMTQMFNKSSKQGLSLSQYAKNVTDHLQIAQKYSFKNGVQGLMSMAELATKIKMDMSAVAQFADKVSNVGDAVNIGAQLQVLGGSFAEFADPLRLLYGSLNDMEDFAKQFGKLTEGLGHLDKTTGQFKIGNHDRLRLKEAAKIMGVDFNKLYEQATAQARRTEIEKVLSTATFKIPKEYEELIKNNATFENGVAGIRAKDGTFKALDKLGKADFEELVSATQSQEENIADIATLLRGYTESMQSRQKAQEDLDAQMHAEEAEKYKNVLNATASSAESLKKLVQFEEARAVGGMVGQQIQALSGPIAMVTSLFGTVMSVKNTKSLSKIGKSLSKIKIRAKGGPTSDVDEHTGYISPTESSPRQEYGISATGGEWITDRASTSKNMPILSYMKNHPGEGLSLSGALGKYKRFESGGHVSYSNSNDGPEYAFTAENNGYAGNDYSGWSGIAGSALGYGNIALKAVGKSIPGAGTLLTGLFAYDEWKEAEKDGRMVLNPNETKGEIIGDAVGWTAGAAAGAAIGSAIFPGVGTVIGGILGGIAGGAGGSWLGGLIGSNWDDNRPVKERFKYRDKITHPLGRAKFDRMQGQYTKNEMGLIVSALSNDGDIKQGELPDALLGKMQNYGNKKTLAQGSKFQFGGDMNFIGAIKDAIDSNGASIFGNSHASGGVKIGGNEFENNEHIISEKNGNKAPTALKRLQQGTLTDADIKPVEPIGKQYEVENKQEKRGKETSEIKFSPLEIKIGGELKIGDTKLDNETIKKIVEETIIPGIMKKLENITNTGYDKSGSRIKTVFA